MDTRTAETRTAYDAAIAEILRDRKYKLDMTRQELADASGIPIDTFRWYLNGTRSIPIGNLLSLTTALKLDIGYVVEEARAKVASTTGD